MAAVAPASTRPRAGGQCLRPGRRVRRVATAAIAWADERLPVPQDRAARAPRGDHPARAAARARPAQRREAAGAHGRRPGAVLPLPRVRRVHRRVGQDDGRAAPRRGTSARSSSTTPPTWRAQGCFYAEPLFSPSEPVMRGTPWQEVFEGYCDGADEARELHGVELRFTPDITRNFPPEIGERLAEWAVRFRDRGVAGISLGGSETPVPAGAVRARLRHRPRGRAQGGAARRRDRRTGVHPLGPRRSPRRPPAARRARRRGRRRCWPSWPSAASSATSRR